MSAKGLLYNLIELLGAALFGALFGACFLFGILYFEENIFHDSVFWNIAAGILGAIIGSTITAYLSDESRKQQIKLSAKVAANNLDYYLNDLSLLSIKILTLEPSVCLESQTLSGVEPIDDLMPILDLNAIMRALDEFTVIMNNDSARLVKEEIIDLSRKLERAKYKIIDYIDIHNYVSKKYSDILSSDLSKELKYFNSFNLSRKKNMSDIISLVDLTRDKLFSFQKKFL